MNIYLTYLKFLMKHKWFVMIECFKVGEYKRGVLHDLSKFLPSEFVPYARYFYTDFTKLSSDEKSKINKDFDIAWLKHIHRNPHHWQHWVLHEDSGKCVKINMPISYFLEMVCDWRGAGKAIHGRDDTDSWYSQNRMKMLLSDETRAKVEAVIKVDHRAPLNNADAPYFHELDERGRSTAWMEGKTYLYFRQPDWCEYQDALDWNTGCWSLTEGRIQQKSDCTECDMCKKDGH